jgi:hypothetical protein
MRRDSRQDEPSDLRKPSRSGHLRGRRCFVSNRFGRSGPQPLASLWRGLGLRTGCGFSLGLHREAQAYPKFQAQCSKHWWGRKITRPRNVSICTAATASLQEPEGLKRSSPQARGIQRAARRAEILLHRGTASRSLCRRGRDQTSRNMRSADRQIGRTSRCLQNHCSDHPTRSETTSSHRHH